MTSPRHAARSVTRLPLALLGMTSLAAVLTPLAGPVAAAGGVLLAVLGGAACAGILVRRHRGELRVERAHARVAQQRLVAELIQTHARQRVVLDRATVSAAERRRDVETERDQLRDELAWARAQVAMRTKDAALAHGVIAEQREELRRLTAALADVRTELAIEREVDAELARGELVLPQGRRVAG